jgi:hypothetical protein
MTTIIDSNLALFPVNTAISPQSSAILSPPQKLTKWATVTYY